jgi:hypothetical protein
MNGGTMLLRNFFNPNEAPSIKGTTKLASTLELSFDTSNMSRYSHQPTTPIRQIKGKSSSFLPLTPQTPSSAIKTSTNTPPVATRTPLASYNNIAFTPPPSLPRAPRTSFSKKLLASDSWRKSSKDSEHSTTAASYDGARVLFTTHK